MTYLGGEESITSGESFSHGLAARIPPPLILRVRRATDIAPCVLAEGFTIDELLPINKGYGA
jgi:hypothetical protein